MSVKRLTDLLILALVAWRSLAVGAADEPKEVLSRRKSSIWSSTVRRSPSN